MWNTATATPGAPNHRLAVCPPQLPAHDSHAQSVTPLLPQFRQLLPRSVRHRFPGLGYGCVQLLRWVELRYDSLVKTRFEEVPAILHI